MQISVGQVVFSKCGHDNGLAFIVIAVQEDYVLLVDGKRRTIEKPKQKKFKHVQPVNFINGEIEKKLLSGEHLLNADFAKAVEQYNKNKVKTNLS